MGSSAPLSAEGARRLAEAHPEWWAEGEPAPVDVTLLGRGESNHAWLLQRGGEELVLRSPHKNVAELPQSLREEHEMLQRVPNGLGARPVALHDDVTEEEPWPYAVTSRVPGRTLPAAAFVDDALIAARVEALALLHDGGDRAGLAAPERIDPVGDAESAYAWWRENEPAAARTLDRLWPAVRRHQELARTAFARTDTVLLHGDPAAANLLVDRSGVEPVVRFVDWEWAQVGDPARDLAFLGGPFHAEPWYALLREAQVRQEAELYRERRLELAGARGVEQADARHLEAALSVDHLLRRREAFLLHEVFFVAAHLARVAAAGEQPGGPTGQEIGGPAWAEHTHAALLDQVGDLVG